MLSKQELSRYGSSTLTDLIDSELFSYKNKKILILNIIISHFPRLITELIYLKMYKIIFLLNNPRQFASLNYFPLVAI